MVVVDRLQIFAGGNGSNTIDSPLFHSPCEFPDAFEDRLGHNSPEKHDQEPVLYENKVKITNERSEADKIESNIMFRDDRDFALREGRDVDSFFEEDQILPAEPEYSNGGHYLGSSGANGRRLQSWSPGEVGTPEINMVSIAIYLPRYPKLPFSFQLGFSFAKQHLT